MSEPSLADQCEALLKLMLNAPEEGYTLDEIQEKLHWSHREATTNILALGRQVDHAYSRSRGRKITRYFLKRPQ